MPAQAPEPRRNVERPAKRVAARLLRRSTVGVIGGACAIAALGAVGGLLGYELGLPDDPGPDTSSPPPEAFTALFGALGGVSLGAFLCAVVLGDVAAYCAAGLATAGAVVVAVVAGDDWWGAVGLMVMFAAVPAVLAIRVGDRLREERRRRRTSASSSPLSR